MQKHSEVRPQGGHVYNYKALQRVGGEPPVLNPHTTGSQFFLFDEIKIDFCISAEECMSCMIIYLMIFYILTRVVYESSII